LERKLIEAGMADSVEGLLTLDARARQVAGETVASLVC
jgi:hypothetical protein